MRMLSGILAAQDFECDLVGDESLSRRPMAPRTTKPLRMMGEDMSGTGEEQPPLHIRGAHLRGIDLHMEVASAQVKPAYFLREFWRRKPQR